MSCTLFKVMPALSQAPDHLPKYQHPVLNQRAAREACSFLGSPVIVCVALQLVSTAYCPSCSEPFYLLIGSLPSLAEARGKPDHCSRTILTTQSSIEHVDVEQIKLIA